MTIPIIMYSSERTCENFYLVLLLRVLRGLV